MDVTSEDWDDGTLTKTKVDNKNISYKVIAGYRFTPKLGVEVNYVQLGDSKFSAYEPGTTPTLWLPGPVAGKAKTKGMSLEGVLAWPFKERFAVFAKGGIFMWNTTMVSNPTLSGGTLALSNRQVIYDNGIRFIYGVGAEQRFHRNWHVRLEWEHTTVRFAETMDRGVDFPSLGVTLDF